jgi:peptide deformylase
MILPIVRMGHPVLQKRAEEVKDVSQPEIQNLIANMLEAFHASGGVGLAAPQVAESVRIVVFQLPIELGKMRGYPDGIPLTTLINPVIEPLSEEMQLGWEGCLSIPGMMGEVPRHQAIRFSGLNEKGQKISREVEGYYARIVQHECDHLEGILYPQRMTNLQKFGFVAEIKDSLVLA